MEINLEEFIAVKGIKALGNQLTIDKIKQVNLLDSLPYEEPEEEKTQETEVEVKVIEETLPIDVPVVEKTEPKEKDIETNSALNKEDKKNALLKKAIQKKKENTDDENQQTLF
jgi:topoisomerase-4 subunit A